MQQVSARVPEEVEENIVAFSDENDIKKSEAIRTLLERGLEYDRIQSENERLQQNLQQLIQQREEHTELVDHTSKRNDRFSAVVRNAETPLCGAGRSGGYSVVTK